MHNVTVFISKYCNYNKLVIRTTIYSRVIQRIAFWLLLSCQQSDVYELPGSQEVFADILQTNRSTLNQELQKLSTMGAIQLCGRKIRVKKRRLLEEILEEKSSSPWIRE